MAPVSTGPWYWLNHPRLRTALIELRLKLRRCVVVVMSVGVFLWQGSAIALAANLTVSAQAQPFSISQVLPSEAEISAPAADFVDAPVSEPSSAATLFEQNCAGCHVNGGNVIRRGKNLKQKAMTRNGYGDVAAIATIITNGKGIMSAYGDRLNENEIGAIAQYVHEQSEAGW